MSNKKNLVTIEPICVRLDDLAELVGLSRSNIERLIRNNDFPKPRQASKGRVVWLVREVKEWAESRPVSNCLPPPNCGKRKSKTNQDSITDLIGAE